MAIFSKFLGDVMSHIIRKNAGEKMNTISDLFIKKKLNSNLYCFQVPSLYFATFMKLKKSGGKVPTFLRKF